MSGYIGKISALVTASTADLERKLVASTTNVKAFGNSLSSVIRRASSSAESSLSGIFTPLQRLQRALQFGSQSQLKIIEDDQVRRLQQAVSISEQISKPLGEAARAFQGLSADVAAGFLPALQRAQQATINLNNTLEQTGSVSQQTFGQVQRIVDQTAQSLQRLSQAQKLIGQGFSGNELEFTNPRLAETLRAGAATTQRAAALPADRLADGDIARQIRGLKQYQDAAVQAEATVASLRLDPQVNPESLLSAERRLESLVETARRAQQQLDATVVRAGGGQTPADKRSAENEIALLQRREQTAKQVEQQRLAAAQRAADSEIALLQRREQTAKQIEQQRLAEAQRTADNEIALLQRREQAAKQAEQIAAAAARRAADNEVALLQRREQAAKQAEQVAAAAAQRAADNEVALLQRREQTAKQAEEQRLAGAQRAADNEIALLQRREQAAKQAEQVAAVAAQRAADNEIALLQRREQAAKQAEQVAEAAAQRVADNEVALLQRREQAAKQAEEQRLAGAQRAADNEIALLQRREQAALEAERRRLEEAAVPLGDRLAEQGRRRVQGLTGDVNIDSTPSGPDGFSAQAQRDIDALATRVGAVRQQLEALPNSVRTRFIPELQRAQAQLVRLQNSPAATVQAIENATQRVQRLEQAARRASAAFDFRNAFGGAGLRGIEEGLNQQALQGYAAQLQILQQTLAGTSQAARGPAVAAFDRLRAAIATAMENGTLETRQARREIDLLTRDAVEATAAARGISPSRLARQLQRAGDIGRGAFGNIGLGIQQAVFAFDDFFSVTGGLDQRIRAAGNNISQLGFVIGGTSGLIAGVLVSALAQGAVALIKFANNGQSSEDQAKSLNRALEQQASIVDQLRQSFESLASSIADGVFSSANRDVRTFAEEIRKLQAEQKKARDDVAAARDPRSASVGADISVLERSLQAESNPVRAQILARRRRELEDSSERVRARVAATPAPTAAQIQDLVGRIGRSLLNINQANRGSPFRDRTIQARGVQISRLGENVPAGTGIADRREQLRRLRETEGQLAGIVDAPRGRFGLSSRVDVTQVLGDVQAQITLIEREISSLVDAQGIAALQAISRTGDSITRNVGDLEEAVSQGISGAAAALAGQESFGEQIRDARDRLVEAAGIDDVTERDRAVDSIEREIRQIEAAVAARGGEVSAIKSVLSSANSFAAALDRASGQLIESVSGDARGAADQARRGANRLQGLADAGLGLPRDAEFAGRQRAERDRIARDVEARAARLRAEEIQLRGRFEQAATAGNLGANAQNLIRQRDAAQAVLDDRRNATPQEINAAEQVLATVNQQLQQVFESLPGAQRLAGLADALDAAAQGAIEFGNAVEQGRNLVLTDAQRVADDFIAQVQQINAALAEGEIDQGQRREAIDRLRQDGLRQLAPTIFGLADQVQNAILQGPSRAALQATDVSTVQGAQELNRLLRGDDSARDQPLVQLQQEANKILERIDRGIQNNEAQLAN